MISVEESDKMIFEKNDGSMSLEEFMKTNEYAYGAYDELFGADGDEIEYSDQLLGCRVTNYYKSGESLEIHLDITKGSEHENEKS